MITKKIESVHNNHIKSLVQLQEKSRIRKKEGLFIIEGIQEVNLAITHNYEIIEILICEEIKAFEKLPTNIQNLSVHFTGISKHVYEKLAYRASTEGIIAVSKNKNHRLSDIDLEEKNPLILVAEAPEKPGNIGALLRTADAAKVDLVIIANPKTDLYNPNIIRSSVGCVFTSKLATANTEDIIDFLNEKKINIYSAILQEATAYHSQDFKKPTAIVVGTEHEGLSDAWRNASTQNIIIPMSGAVDSMNVSVAAGILIFEAKRQRGF